MAITYPQDSEFAKEAVKWEATHTVFGPPGRPYVKHEYPMMLHKAGRRDGVSMDILETCIVPDEGGRERERHRGFYATPKEALEAFAALDLEIARAAAERAFTERRMGPKAQAEAAVADAAVGTHVPSVPETPIKKSHKKQSTAAQAAGA